MLEIENILLKGEASGGCATRYTWENSPVPTSSTRSNRETKLWSTSAPLAAVRFRLGLLGKFGKYSRGPVGVAGIADELLETGRWCSRLWRPEIERPLGSGGKLPSCGVWGEVRATLSRCGLTGERQTNLVRPDRGEWKGGTARAVLEIGDGEFKLLSNRP